MTAARKKLITQILIVLSIGLVAFLVWEIIKAIKAGENTIAGIIKAPFTVLGKIWTGITSFFSGTTSTGFATPQPAPIKDSSGNTIAMVDPSSPFYSSFAPPDQAATQDQVNYLLGGATPPTQSFNDYLAALVANSNPTPA